MHVPFLYFPLLRAEPPVHLACKACRARAVVAVTLPRGMGFGPDVDAASEATLHACRVCGDGWLALVTPAEGGATLDFAHHDERGPVLRRTGFLPDDEPARADGWSFRVDDVPTSEADWTAQLAARRARRRSACAN